MIRNRKNDTSLNDDCFGEIFQLSENKKQKKETERPGEKSPIKKRRKKNEEKGRKSEENEKGGKKSKGEKKNYDRGEKKGTPHAGWEEKSQKEAEGAGEERREKEKEIIDHSQQSTIACQHEASECVRDLSRAIIKCADILSLLNAQLNILNVELETTRKENGEKEKKEREIASREYGQKSRENRASESASETEEEEEYETNRGMEEAMYWDNRQQWQRDNF